LIASCLIGTGGATDLIVVSTFADNRLSADMSSNSGGADQLLMQPGMDNRRIVAVAVEIGEEIATRSKPPGLRASVKNSKVLCMTSTRILPTPSPKQPGKLLSMWLGPSLVQESFVPG
jgi:hypothetical protein